MDPELLTAVKALVASGTGSKVELAVIAVTVTLTVLGYLERRIRPLVQRALESFLRREREQSVTLRLLAEKAGIPRDAIQRAVLEEELRERAAATRPEEASLQWSFAPSAGHTWFPQNGNGAPAPAPPSTTPTTGGAS